MIENEDDTQPRQPSSPWFASNRAQDLDFIRAGFSRLRWQYVAGVERFLDEVLGLPDPDEEPDRYEAALRDPAVRRLRATAALRLVREFPADVEPVFVTEARRAGASWTEIGDAVDVSRQNARKKWLHLDVPKGDPVGPRFRDLFGDLGDRRGTPDSAAGAPAEPVEAPAQSLPDDVVEDVPEEASTP